MINLDIFCELFYSAHYIPIAHYVGDHQITLKSSLETNDNIFFDAASNLLATAKNPAVYASPDTGLYGIIRKNGTEDSLMIGPAFSSKLSNESVHTFLKNNMIPADHKEGISSLLDALPLLTYNRLISLLGLIHYEINDETISPTEHFNLLDTSAKNAIATKHALHSVESRDLQNEHGTYKFEQLLMNYVRGGETEQLQKLFNNVIKTQHLTEGNVAATPLRQAKNILIGHVTMVGKVGAIEGGMAVEEVYNLIDLYIQECEKAQSIDAVKALQYSLVMDFAERVNRAKMPEGISKEIFSCVEFIKHHSNDSIGLDDVADYIGKSRAYLTRKFKEEMGITVGDFIISSKLQEARSLLLHTDYSLTEISNYLCFSSQAYFHNVFKKKYGITPMEFRNKS